MTIIELVDKRTNRVIHWFRASDLIEAYNPALHYVALASCDNPERVYTRLATTKPLTLEDLGL